MVNKIACTILYNGKLFFAAGKIIIYTIAKLIKTATMYAGFFTAKLGKF
jgi:hypothetical protein